MIVVIRNPPTGLYEGVKLMKQITNPGNRRPLSANAHANLDIRLEGWPGTAAVGFLSAAFVAVVALWFKSRS